MIRRRQTVRLRPSALRPSAVAAFATALFVAGACSSRQADDDSLASSSSAASSELRASRDGRSRADAMTPALALETFDSAWRIVRDTHFDPELGGLDWDAVRAELRPQAESAADAPALRVVIADMLARLSLSHYAIIPRDLRADADPGDMDDDVAASSTTLRRDDNRDDDREIGADRSVESTEFADSTERADSTESGTLGMTVRLVENRAVVTAVRPGGPADRAGVGMGWVVDRIGRRSVSAILGDLESAAPDADSVDAENAGWGELIAVSVLTEMLSRPVGRRVRLELLDGSDERIELTLESVALGGETIEFGPLRLSSEFSARAVTDREWRDAMDLRDSHDGGRHVGVVGFSTWIVPIAAPFHRAVDEYRDADGIIIDLRGNLGGIGGMVMGIGGHFVDETKSLGTLRNRHGQLEFRINPRRTDADGALVNPFAGPVAILVDGMSGSTSEIFAGGMQAIGRARIFGSTSAGQALPAVISPLPSGDTLMHAVADYILPDGTRLEGRGVVPDEPIRVTRDDLLAGRDPVLLAALRWIASHRPETAAAAVRGGGRLVGVRSDSGGPPREQRMTGGTGAGEVKGIREREVPRLDVTNTSGTKLAPIS